MFFGICLLYILDQNIELFELLKVKIKIFSLFTFPFVQEIHFIVKKQYMYENFEMKRQAILMS